jgi:hypothetical protein
VISAGVTLGQFGQDLLVFITPFLDTLKSFGCVKEWQKQTDRKIILTSKFIPILAFFLDF